MTDQGTHHIRIVSNSAAQSKVAGFHSDSTRLVALQQEVKEKSLLIGKLRHEGKSTLPPISILAVLPRDYRCHSQRTSDGSTETPEKRHVGKQC